MPETTSSNEKENLFHKAANRIFCLGKYCLAPCVRDKEKTTIDLYLVLFSKEILRGELNTQYWGIDPISGRVCFPHARLPRTAQPREQICWKSKAQPAQTLSVPNMGPAETETLHFRYYGCLWWAEPTKAVRRHVDILCCVPNMA